MDKSSAGLNPFEAPREDTTPYVEILPGEHPRRFRRDPSGLTSLLKAFLWLSLLMHVLWAASAGVAYLGLLGEEAIESRVAILRPIWIIVYLVTGFLFLKWVYRMNLNVHGFGAKRLATTPGWAVGWYFIPIFNLWKPYKTMKEIWQASSRPDSWPKVIDTGLVGIWWALYLITGLINQIYGYMAVRATDLDLDTWRTLTLTDVSGEVAAIVLCLVTIQLVARICEMQKAWVEGEATESPWVTGR